MIDRLYIESELNSYPYIIDVRETVTSTNSLMKEEAKCGKAAYSVLVSSSQTEGRGRMGRSFYSPDGSGIYMSVLLRPENGINPLHITTDAAVAVAVAIEKLSGEIAGIKWVNDIYIRNKKVAGILAEASVGEGGYVVFGIGVNVLEPEGVFPDDIKMRAGSIFKENTDCRNRSIIDGKEIDIIKNSSVERAVALSIDDDYSLIVKKEDGSIEKINSGDVSIRV